MRDVIAADIGGTNLRLARIQPNGEIVEEIRIHADFSSLQHDSPEAAKEHILTTFSAACQPLLKKADITAIGIGFPGFFIGDSGILAGSPNLPQLHNFPLASQLAERLGIRVSAQNDALCAAIGEQRFGAGRDADNLLHVTLGTGVGGGLVLAKKPYTGEHGMAMEFGHLRVARGTDARICGCGGCGCLEAYASATAISDRYADETGIATDSHAIHTAACNGDQSATMVLQEAGAYLGQALAESIKLLDIETITISGGLSGAWDIIYPPLLEHLNENLIPPLKNRIRVLRSTLDDRGGLLGAAALAGA